MSITIDELVQFSQAIKAKLKYTDMRGHSKSIIKAVLVANATQFSPTKEDLEALDLKSETNNDNFNKDEFIKGALEKLERHRSLLNKKSLAGNHSPVVAYDFPTDEQLRIDGYDEKFIALLTRLRSQSQNQSLTQSQSSSQTNQSPFQSQSPNVPSNPASLVSSSGPKDRDDPLNKSKNISRTNSPITTLATPDNNLSLPMQNGQTDILGISKPKQSLLQGDKGDKNLSATGANGLAPNGLTATANISNEQGNVKSPAQDKSAPGSTPPDNNPIDSIRFEFKIEYVDHLIEFAKDIQKSAQELVNEAIKYYPVFDQNHILFVHQYFKEIFAIPELNRVLIGHMQHTAKDAKKRKEEKEATELMTDIAIDLDKMVRYLNNLKQNLDSLKSEAIKLQRLQGSEESMGPNHTEYRITIKSAEGAKIKRPKIIFKFQEYDTDEQTWGETVTLSRELPLTNKFEQEILPTIRSSKSSNKVKGSGSIKVNSAIIGNSQKFTPLPPAALGLLAKQKKLRDNDSDELLSPLGSEIPKNIALNKKPSANDIAILFSMAKATGSNTSKIIDSNKEPLIPSSSGQPNKTLPIQKDTDRKEADRNLLKNNWTQNEPQTESKSRSEAGPVSLGSLKPKLVPMGATTFGMPILRTASNGANNSNGTNGTLKGNPNNNANNISPNMAQNGMALNGKEPNSTSSSKQKSSDGSPSQEAVNVNGAKTKPGRSNSFSAI